MINIINALKKAKASNTKLLLATDNLGNGTKEVFRIRVDHDEMGGIGDHPSAMDMLRRVSALPLENGNPVVPEDFPETI